MGFPGGSAGKESACHVGNLGLIPGSGRSPGDGNGYPLQYSGLENSMNYSMGSQRPRQDWMTSTFPFFKWKGRLEYDFMHTHTYVYQYKLACKHVEKQYMCMSVFSRETEPVGCIIHIYIPETSSSVRLFLLFIRHCFCNFTFYRETRRIILFFP